MLIELIIAIVVLKIMVLLIKGNWEDRIIILFIGITILLAFNAKYLYYFLVWARLM